MMIDIKNINLSWQNIILEQINQNYFAEIIKFLDKEYIDGKTIYPMKSDIFNAFNQTSFDDIKVVILGQDPYHGEGESHGLCFSVRDGIKIPPSLRNMFKELVTDIDGFVIPKSGNLVSWANQGVLLLNSTLTVRKDTPNSHKDIGWQQFTDNIIKQISDKKQGVVFMLWGAYAQGKIDLIDQSKHLVLQTTHPSPFSAYRGFLGCKHFSKANEYLVSIGKKEINWKLV